MEIFPYNDFMIEKLIKENKYKFTKAEKNLSNWILKNNWNKKSITKISKESGESIATINRFAKKNGFVGFKDMKSLSTFHKQNYKNYINNNFYLNDVFYSYKETSKKLPIDEINFIVKKILEKRKIYFYGQSFTFILSNYVARKFMKINFNVEIFNTSSDLSIILPNKDVVHIFISNSGRNPNIKKACKKIYNEDKNQTIISLSASSKNNIQEYSNSYINNFFYSSIDQDPFELPFISYYINQYVLDIIFNLVYEKNLQKNKEIIESISKLKE